MEPDLIRLFREDSAVIMMSGRKGFGKTSFSLRLGEEALENGLISRMATNIRTEDERVDCITNLPDLKTWLAQRGRKYFILDEAGQYLSRIRFMSKLNKMILDIIQLIRHYDATFTAIAPNEKFIDSNYLNTDILDCRIKKISLHFAQVKNYLSWQSYTLSDIPDTNIKFWSKDIAPFSLEKAVKLDKLSVEESCAYLYGKGKSYEVIGQGLNPPKHRTQVKRMVQRYLSLHFHELKKRDT